MTGSRTAVGFEIVQDAKNEYVHSYVNFLVTQKGTPNWP